MGLYKYSIKLKDEESKQSSSAQAHDLNLSYKDLTQVCRAIKGRSIPEARKLLEEAMSMKKPLLYHNFHKGSGHKGSLGGKKGRFPVKEAKAVLELLENAVSNAQFKGLDVKGLFVKHAAAYKQNVLRRYRRFFASSPTLGYGKHAVWGNYTLSWMEMIVSYSEKVASSSSKKKEKKQAKAKKAESKVEEKKVEKV